MVNSLTFRTARLNDSPRLAELERRLFVSKEFTLRPPKSDMHFRKEIGSLLIKNGLHLVATENDNIIGFIEIQMDANNRSGKIGFPMVDPQISGREEIQRELIAESLDRFKLNEIQTIHTYVSFQNKQVINIFTQNGFIHNSVVLEIWKGEINPNYNTSAEDMNIRPIERKDAEITYAWMKNELNELSPLFLTFDEYLRFFNSKNELEGWAIAEINGKPIAMIATYTDHHNNITVFGPYNKVEYERYRIPLFNEMLIYHKLHGKRHVKVMRIRSFQNDQILFINNNLQLAQMIHVYEKREN